ncbi:hypothetical protein C4588_05890 [Candidatus Parcubacteria bacterium]|nr:MAG: hypothetical protein C4588_05890 [Candidatus Parcubacteria bacterium]
MPEQREDEDATVTRCKYVSGEFYCFTPPECFRNHLAALSNLSERGAFRYFLKEHPKAKNE